MYEIVFYIFAAITIVSTALVAGARNVSHAAFALLFTLFGVAGIFVLLGADFLGVSQVMIYVGGILVLFLFGMMLTAGIDKLADEHPPLGRLAGGIFGATTIFAVLVQIIWGTTSWTTAKAQEIPGASQGTTSILGSLLMGDYALLFIASAIAILVALVGAAMISRGDRQSPGRAAGRM